MDEDLARSRPFPAKEDGLEAEDEEFTPLRNSSGSGSRHRTLDYCRLWTCFTRSRSPSGSWILQMSHTLLAVLLLLTALSSVGEAAKLPEKSE
ncbi:hypothetical protein RRG08_018784 [Elysia crispata]|uniref:Uncharacterized protein n=1 Tax=Elysia crispata TaxID=231223 RepID=A0AAE1AR49_9GAST|nr:hypothetical protein RRG08_018784 [Elysia crispata]